MKIDPKHYAYRVLWSSEDQQFVGLCAEFPSLSFLADQQIEALAGINGLVVSVVNDLENSNENIPQPILERNYSGTLSLRLGKEIHRKASLAAAEAQQSLNAFITDKVALHCK